MPPNWRAYPFKEKGKLVISKHIPLILGKNML